MSIISDGGGMPPSSARLEREEDQRLEDAAKVAAMVEAMLVRGFRYRHNYGTPIISCLGCGCFIADADLHEGHCSAKQLQRT